MVLTESTSWKEQVRGVLERYDIDLLRAVSDRLFKPRSQWPADELIERCLATLDNVAVIDRRLRALEPPSRHVLTLIARSGRMSWKLGSLAELLHVINPETDARPYIELLEAGLLYPLLAPGRGKLKSFEHWIGTAAGALMVFAVPEVARRVVADEIPLPACETVNEIVGGVRESDGLEWPLRLAAIWQQVDAAPLRRTQNGAYFKRDLERLRQDPLLNAPVADGVVELPDMGPLAVELAVLMGLLQEGETELTAGSIPASWEQGPFETLAALWAGLPMLDGWHAGAGLREGEESRHPFTSAYYAAVLLLANLADDAWASPDVVADGVVSRHPFWKNLARPEPTSRRRGPVAPDPRASVKNFLLGLAQQLRIVQAAQDSDKNWVVKLSPVGRWLLGLAPTPTAPPLFPQTLLVQPNLEIIAYRQGLSPMLIATLSQFATWKTFGPACTLQLEPDSVYRALERGLTFDIIRQTLDQHGMKATPTAVIESLRTWSNKRERIGVYPSATLFEFASAEDLNDAIARGLPATRLDERLAVVADEGSIDFRHFRLTGTRDYALPPEKCVDVEADGVTLAVDLGRSDLLVETEIVRFAQPLEDRPTSEPRRYFRLTPASLTEARDGGLLLADLEQWFLQRTNDGLPPAGRLLFTAGQNGPCELRKEIVLHVGSAEIADGLQQWPQTRSFVRARLGPKALAIDQDELAEFRRRLAGIGFNVSE